VCVCVSVCVCVCVCIVCVYEYLMIVYVCPLRLALQNTVGKKIMCAWIVNVCTYVCVTHTIKPKKSIINAGRGIHVCKRPMHNANMHALTTLSDDSEYIEQATQSQDTCCLQAHTEGKVIHSGCMHACMMNKKLKAQDYLIHTHLNPIHKNCSP